MEKKRLQVFLAQCGIGSRRYCEQFIVGGRVTVNGSVATLGCSVSSGDCIALDGKKITPHLRLVYLAVHKPRRYICANHDPQGRRLVSDLFADGFEQRLFHVGRLDYLSSGLIFYTNDGAFTRIATHPAFKIEKDYLIQSREEIPEDFLKSYQESLVVRDERYRLKRYRRLEGNKVVLTLGEGKNREIRRVFDAYHIRVERIHRLRIGCVFLKGIPQGGYRFLKTKEVDWFKKRGEEK